MATEDGASFEPGSRVGLEDPTAESLPGRGAGFTVRYGVRVLDRRGRLSPLVVARDLVLVEPPPPPSGLRAEATADGVRLEWQPPDGQGNARYNLYRAPAGEPFGERPIHVEPLPVPEYLDSDVISGRSYTYMVRTSASEALQYRESISCPAVTLMAEDHFAPQSPQRLVAVQEGRAVRLFWNPNPEKDLAGYRVYRRGETAEWARVGPNGVEQPLYLDDSVTAGQHVAYRVTAVDRASPPNESAPSEEVEVDVGEEPASPGEDRP